MPTAKKTAAAPREVEAVPADAVFGDETEPRSKSEDLADEAIAPTKPEGAPDLKPPSVLNRRTRAEFYRRLKPVMSLADKVQDLNITDDSTESAIDAAAELYDMLGDLEDLMSWVAPDADEFAAWALAASDEDLMALFTWYMQEFQPGEAKPSSS